MKEINEAWKELRPKIGEFIHICDCIEKQLTNDMKLAKDIGYEEYHRGYVTGQEELWKSLKDWADLDVTHRYYYTEGCGLIQDIFHNLTPHDFMTMMDKFYEDKETEFKVGDEIKGKKGSGFEKYQGVVTEVVDGKYVEYISAEFKKNIIFNDIINNFEKTGRSFDFFKEIK